MDRMAGAVNTGLPLGGAGGVGCAATEPMAAKISKTDVEMDFTFRSPSVVSVDH
jgi:hypothetical protein